MATLEDQIKNHKEEQRILADKIDTLESEAAEARAKLKANEQALTELKGVHRSANDTLERLKKSVSMVAAPLTKAEGELKQIEDLLTKNVVDALKPIETTEHADFSALSNSAPPRKTFSAYRQAVEKAAIELTSKAGALEKAREEKAKARALLAQHEAKGIAARKVLDSALEELEKRIALAGVARNGNKKAEVGILYFEIGKHKEMVGLSQKAVDDSIAKLGSAADMLATKQEELEKAECEFSAAEKILGAEQKLLKQAEEVLKTVIAAKVNGSQ